MRNRIKSKRDLQIIAGKLSSMATDLRFFAGEDEEGYEAQGDPNTESKYVSPSTENEREDLNMETASKVATAEDRKVMAADLNKIADKMDELQEKVAAKKISDKRANEVRSQIKKALEYIADEMEVYGLDEEMMDYEGEEMDEDEVELEDDEGIEDLY